MSSLKLEQNLSGLEVNGRGVISGGSVPNPVPRYRKEDDFKRWLKLADLYLFTQPEVFRTALLLQALPNDMFYKADLEGISYLDDYQSVKERLSVIFSRPKPSLGDLFLRGQQHGESFVEYMDAWKN